MMRRLARPLGVLAVAAALWLPSVHVLLRPIAHAPAPDGAPSPWARNSARPGAWWRTAPSPGRTLPRYTRAALAQMQAGPVLSGESYPDECSTFCNTGALAALRLEDFLDGTDRSAFFAEWVRAARAKLVEPKTGLLVSSYRRNGAWLDGPEGSRTRCPICSSSSSCRYS